MGTVHRTPTYFEEGGLLSTFSELTKAKASACGGRLSSLINLAYCCC
jgi:hypothetical protein